MVVVKCVSRRIVVSPAVVAVVKLRLVATQDGARLPKNSRDWLGCVCCRVDAGATVRRPGEQWTESSPRTIQYTVK